MLTHTHTQLIFCSDPSARKKLNAATHLPVAVELVKRVAWHWATGRQMVWIDMPLLFETGAHKWMSRSVVVLLDQETQVWWG